jgi:hypothetical protein
MKPIVPVDNATTPPEPLPAKTRGRKRSEFNDKERAVVFEAAKLGLRHTIIAKLVDTSPNTLRKHCATELFKGAVEADKEVLTTLHDMATSKHCPAATIFWAKTRCAYTYKGLNTTDDLPVPEPKTPKRPKPSWSDTDPDSASPKVSTLTHLNVYNNEGEPNADY